MRFHETVGISQSSSSSFLKICIALDKLNYNVLSKDDLVNVFDLNKLKQTWNIRNSQRKRSKPKKLHTICKRVKNSEFCTKKLYKLLMLMDMSINVCNNLEPMIDKNSLTEGIINYLHSLSEYSSIIELNKKAEPIFVLDAIYQLDTRLTCVDWYFRVNLETKKIKFPECARKSLKQCDALIQKALVDCNLQNISVLGIYPISIRTKPHDELRILYKKYHDLIIECLLLHMSEICS